jgi:glycosyltransferase involved in cell wall biosynthesis
MKTMGSQTNNAGKPWRVLIVQKFASLGGSQKSLVHHLELLDRSRFEPRVIVSNRGWLTEKLDELRVPWSLVQFGHWINLASLPRNLLLIARLKKYIRQHGIHLIHANEHWIAPPCYWAARRAGVPAICHFRTGLEDLTPRRIRKYLYGRFDRVLVVAEVLRKALAKEISDPEKIIVVRDGVEPFPMEPCYWGKRRTRVVINVGAIYEVKGQAKILERALPWLEENRRHFLLFVGGTRADSDYVGSMKRAVAEQGLQKQVLFLGSREDVPRLLRAADALAAYSTVEGIPRVVMEAMFAGRPVMVSDTPGMDEVVVDGETGRIVNFDDAANPLLQALRDMTSNHSGWETMGRRARARALKRYSIRAMSDAIQAAYAELLEQKNYGKKPN